MISTNTSELEGSQALSHMDTKSPRCSTTSNSRPHPLFIEGGPKLAVTLKSRENRGFADCPPHRDRTVRHSKPTARNAMITCQNRPLEPFADCPLPRGGPSAIQTLRTLRETASLGKLKVEGRTVRPPWVDRPPFTSCKPPEPIRFLSQKFQ